MLDFRNYIVKEVVHIRVEEANYSAALLFQPGCTEQILIHLFDVAFTFYFDDQSRLGIVEISNKATDRVLPAKFNS